MVYSTIISTSWAILTVLLLTLTVPSKAQYISGFSKAHNQLMEKSPAYRAQRALLDKQIQQEIERQRHQARTDNSSTATIHIPVVVHIVYNTEDENLPYKRIEDQLEALNRDFNNENEDLSQVPEAFEPAIGNMNIRFCLASWQDEKGNWQPGITRTTTQVTSFKQDDAVKQTTTGGRDAVRPGSP